MKKSNTMKALAKAMHRENINEWYKVFNTKGATAKEPNRPKVYGLKDVQRDYPRSAWYREGTNEGATKVCFTFDENGNEHEFFVVKRVRDNYDGYRYGNQVIGEVNFWLKYANTADEDFLCPILKYYTFKSDKIDECSDKAFESSVIISQKCVEVMGLTDACNYAEALNNSHGFHGEKADDRKARLVEFIERENVHDVVLFDHDGIFSVDSFDIMDEHSGNCGVIFDYLRNCYKAVIIDYGL